MSEFIRFLEKYFPEVDMPSFHGDKLYYLVCESNIMARIYLKYMDFDDLGVSSDRLTYYVRFRDGVNKLLMYTPINDGIGIYACMRYSIEQFLKFIYSLYFPNDISKINTTSYRHIKEDFKNSKSLQQYVRERIEKIYSYYAKYSNDIHDKTVVYDKELEFIGDVIKGKNDFVREIENDLSNFLFITYEIINEIFKIEYIDLNIAEKMSIVKIGSKKRKNRILKIMKYTAD